MWERLGWRRKSAVQKGGPKRADRKERAEDGAQIRKSGARGAPDSVFATFLSVRCFRSVVFGPPFSVRPFRSALFGPPLSARSSPLALSLFRP